MTSAPYDAIARRYDSAIGDRTADRHYLAEILDRNGTMQGDLLELACGTGEMLLSFRENFRLTGLDRSAAMIDEARRKLPDATLIQADMRSFETGRSYDVILLLFNSLNQVPEADDWDLVFRRAAQHLRPNGLFVLELNMPAKLERLAGAPARYHTSGRDHYIMEVARRDRPGPIAVDMHIRIFTPASPDHYELLAETIHEIALEEDTVRDKLAGCFERIEVRDRQAGSDPAGPRTEVAVFTCRGRG
ncbi:class I SAM-dependent DNA methyltransferase [Inquilinus limosus]|uniref:Methyltransferase domain-containing protein n=1 Tax=Inquilinus limosus TaxID=171674 RepID=A0A211ZIW1_9PROT|nr:class I SAM-dependent methyltransferase [Inquilinus limosus]OWJ65212.1 hypothetical protein BWR60_20725 [Inquilinus limosus]